MTKNPYGLRTSFCRFGLILGSLFFAASFTPSLIPRNFEIQGALAGIAFGAGYGIGVILNTLWRYLELPGLDRRLLKFVKPLISTIVLAIMLLALYHSASWQNSVRHAVGMDSVDSAYPFSVTLIAILCFLILLFITRGLIILGRSIAGKFYNRFPRRISIVAGAVITIALTFTFANGVLVKYTFRFLDNSFQRFDALLEPDRPQPLIPERAGNPLSKLEWRKLGRAGREFVASGPRAEEISAFTQQKSFEPIRLYAGLQIAESPEERAALLLEELISLNAFERQALLIITPTGTGWVDPSAIDGLEFLLNGDIASVALQYSYLSSPLSLLFQPESGLASAEALFRVVYDHWKELPAETPAQAVSSRAKSWCAQLATFDHFLRYAGGSNRRSSVERPTLRKYKMAFADKQSRYGFERMATHFSKWAVYTFYEPRWNTGRQYRAMGRPALRLSATW